MKKQKSNVQTAAVNLRLDWCSYKAAKYAVMNWHYSKKMPAGKNVYIGAWEENKFIGVVIFGMGSGNSTNGTKYGLTRSYEMAELVRVALNNHLSPTSKVVSFAIKMVSKYCSGLRLLISFADMEQNHLGILYQATNWIYAGTTGNGRVGFIIHGRKTHTRSIGAKKGGIQSLGWVQNHLDPNAKIWTGKEKHRYLYPLDKEMRKQIEPLRKPYPKRPAGEKVSRPANQPEVGGSIPTAGLEKEVELQRI